ncbi:MAG TPA: DUF192 domain-containing protein [Acidimicrobiales bacterium]|nr:DUF192 domain-containing protein [Acidimicrobiales bacterium]
MDQAVPAGPWWLLRDGEVLAAAEVARSTAARMRGLLGRSGYEGAFYLPRTRAVHTIGMRFAIDVAYLDSDLRVLAVGYLPPWRFGRPRRGTRSVLEAESGAFERWGLRQGDQLELHGGS